MTSIDNVTPAPIPNGYTPHARRSPFTDPWRPLYARQTPTELSLGTVLREAHCNSRGLVHGGFISALADNAMGLSVVQQLTEDGTTIRGLVTTNLSIDFTGQAKVGDWIQSESEVIRIGGSLAFVRGRLLSGDETVALCHATFRIMRDSRGER